MKRIKLFNILKNIYIYTRMKRIKLFEAFTSKGKITKANLLLYHWGM